MDRHDEAAGLAVVLENLLEHLQERPWWRVGEMYLLVQNRYDHTRSRLDIE